MLDCEQGKEADAPFLIACDKGDCKTWLDMVLTTWTPNTADGVAIGAPEA